MHIHTLREREQQKNTSAGFQLSVALALFLSALYLPVVFTVNITYNSDVNAVHQHS